MTPKFSKFSRSYTDDGSGRTEVQNYNENRTSSFMWLEKASVILCCAKSKGERLKLWGLPACNVGEASANSRILWMGQEFKTHHDMGERSSAWMDIEAGDPRIDWLLSCMLKYTAYRGRGHTEFPSLKGLSMTPKRGMAVLFPDILLQWSS